MLKKQAASDQASSQRSSKQPAIKQAASDQASSLRSSKQPAIKQAASKLQSSSKQAGTGREDEDNGRVGSALVVDEFVVDDRWLHEGLSEVGTHEIHYTRIHPVHPQTPHQHEWMKRILEEHA